MKEPLTICERKVYALAQKPLQNKEIAHLLNVSPRTIKYHLTEIYRKCQVKDRLEFLVKYGEIQVP